MLQYIPARHPDLEKLLKATPEPRAGDGIHAITPDPFPQYDLVRGKAGLLAQEPDNITLHIFEHAMFWMHGELAIARYRSDWIVWFRPMPFGHPGRLLVTSPRAVLLTGLVRRACLHPIAFSGKGIPG